MKEKYAKAFMDMAERFAEESEAEKLKVCCLLIKNDAIISIGLNGSPSGFYTNRCEDEDGKTEWYVRHAEVAALNKLRRSTESSIGSEAFVTHNPCKDCAIDLVEAGITKVYYRHDYRCDKGLIYLKDKKVEVQKI